MSLQIAAAIAVEILQTLIPTAGVAAAGAAVVTALKRGKISFNGMTDDLTKEETDKLLRHIETDSAKGLPLNTILMRDYHAQGLSQSKVSFRVSLLFASLGFGIIALAIGLFLQQTPDPAAAWTDSVGKPIFTLVSGVIIEAVSALFFVQSNKSRELMAEFFDKLRSDRKLDEALTLANGISDQRVSSNLKALIALNFADVTPSEFAIKCLLDPNSTIPLNSQQDKPAPLPSNDLGENSTN